MQPKIFFISTLIILLSVMFANAQPKLITREELDKREVKEFVDKFTKSLEKTKDLDITLKKFASKTFKSNLKKTDNSYEEQLNELSLDEQYEHKVLIFNIFYLAIIWNSGTDNFMFSEDENESDEDDDDEVSKLFPPEVLFILIQSALLSKTLDFEDSKELKKITSQDVLDSNVIMKNALMMFKISIENRESSWEETYKKNTQTLRMRFELFDAERCKDDDCYGFPEKTRIYITSVFPYFLVLARENGKLKLIHMEIHSN